MTEAETELTEAQIDLHTKLNQLIEEVASRGRIVETTQITQHSLLNEECVGEDGPQSEIATELIRHAIDGLQEKHHWACIV